MKKETHIHQMRRVCMHQKRRRKETTKKCFSRMKFFGYETCVKKDVCTPNETRVYVPRQKKPPHETYIHQNNPQRNPLFHLDIYVVLWHDVGLFWRVLLVYICLIGYIYISFDTCFGILRSLWTYVSYYEVQNMSQKRYIYIQRDEYTPKRPQKESYILSRHKCRVLRYKT